MFGAECESGSFSQCIFNLSLSIISECVKITWNSSIFYFFDSCSSLFSYYPPFSTDYFALASVKVSQLSGLNGIFILVRWVLYAREIYSSIGDGQA